MKFTIIGGNGFIGRSLTKALLKTGHEVFIPKKNNELHSKNDLGIVIYAAGITSDFRTRPYDTIRAHISTLSNILEKGEFDNLIYLSSTRIYKNSSNTIENTDISINSNKLDDFYDLTKLTGESLCTNFGKSKTKIIRLSNVLGNDFNSNNFIYSLIKSSYSCENTILKTSLESTKDYINIEDVIDILIKITLKGSEKCYNLASGENISNSQIIASIKSVNGASFKVVKNPINRIDKPINIDLIKREFNFVPKNRLIKIQELTKSFKSQKPVN